jgi:hypothetical protein
MSTFNAEQFMQTEIEQKGEVDYVPIPEAEYQGVIKELKPGTTPKGAAYLEVYWIIDDQEVRELMESDEVVCRQSIWLDITDSGALDFGKNKNIKLNRLRDALGQNDGKPWSPMMLMGQVATVQVKHRLGDDGTPYAEIRGVRA